MLSTLTEHNARLKYLNQICTKSYSNLNEMLVKFKNRVKFRLRSFHAVSPG